MKIMQHSDIEWIGEIPKEWKVNKGKQLYISNDGGVWGEDATGTNDTIVLRSTEQDIDGRLSINEPAMRHLSEIERQNAMLKEGDLIITKSSGSPSHIGKTSIIGKDVASMDCCFSNFIQRIRIDGIPQYYWYVFNSFVVKNQFSYLSTTTTGINNINAKTLDQLQLLYPPLSEQQKIADYLDKVCGEVDEMVVLQETMIEELKAYKQSAITEAVTKGLNPNAPMRNSGIDWIGEIPEGWKIVHFSKINWIRARLGWKGLKAEEYTETGYPFLSAFNIVNDKLDWSNLNFINQERYDESPEIKLSLGDLLLVKDGAGIGKCAVVEDMPYGESTVNSSIAVVTPIETNIYPKFQYYYFKSQIFQNTIWLLKIGMGVPHLTQENMKGIVLPCPSMEEQRAIVSYLDTKCSEIDSLIALKQAKIEELKEYKKSVIYEYVTGKKEVV